MDSHERQAKSGKLLPNRASADAALLNRLPEVAARPESWNDSDDELWNDFLKERYDRLAIRLASDFGSVADTNTGPDLDDLAKAERLLTIGWAKVAPETGDIGYENHRSDHPPGNIPVLLMLRDGVFQVEPRTELLLRFHPGILASSPPYPHPDPEPYFKRRLQDLRDIEIAEDIGEGVNHVILDQGEYRNASECSKQLLLVEALLKPDLRHWFDDKDEDLSWLNWTVKSKRFWRLLGASFNAGMALERYRTFSEEGLHDTISDLIRSPRGQNPQSPSLAIERVIRRFLRDKQLDGEEPNATAMNILDWLGGTRPYNEGEALAVEHDLWTEPLEGLIWSKFEDLVKRNKRRVSNDGPLEAAKNRLIARSTPTSGPDL